MLALAEDSGVSAVVVITDGEIAYPGEDMPYCVLWVMPKRGNFLPPYGSVITIEGDTP
jgi:hypothetical protein